MDRVIWAMIVGLIGFYFGIHEKELACRERFRMLQEQQINQKYPDSIVNMVDIVIYGEVKSTK